MVDCTKSELSDKEFSAKDIFELGQIKIAERIFRELSMYDTKNLGNAELLGFEIARGVINDVLLGVKRGR